MLYILFQNTAYKSVSEYGDSVYSTTNISDIRYICVGAFSEWLQEVTYFSKTPNYSISLHDIKNLTGKFASASLKIIAFIKFVDQSQQPRLIGYCNSSHLEYLTYIIYF